MIRAIRAMIYMSASHTHTGSYSSQLPLPPVFVVNWCL